MIAHVRGTVTHRSAGSVVIDVGGVGYLVHVTAADHIPAQGQEVELHTSLQVREESMTLYGFASEPELRLFELLLTAAGVGPKLALAALATHRPEVLRTALAGEDATTLTAIPGVGPKLAKRLVLELKDKVGGGVDGVAVVGTDGTPSGALAEVRDALLGLGYSAGEVQAALAEVGPADGEATSELLRRALRAMGAGASDGARA